MRRARVDTYALLRALRIAHTLLHCVPLVVMVSLQVTHCATVLRCCSQWTRTAAGTCMRGSRPRGKRRRERANVRGAEAQAGFFRCRASPRRAHVVDVELTLRRRPFGDAAELRRVIPCFYCLHVTRRVKKKGAGWRVHWQEGRRKSTRADVKNEVRSGMVRAAARGLILDD